MTIGICLLSMLAVSATANAQLWYNYVPATILPVAQKELKATYEAKAYARVFPEADDLDGW